MQYREKVSKNIAMLLVSRYQKVSRHARYQYREILVSRYIEVSSVSPSTTLDSSSLQSSCFLAEKYGAHKSKNTESKISRSRSVMMTIDASPTPHFGQRGTSIGLQMSQVSTTFGPKGLYICIVIIVFLSHFLARSIACYREIRACNKYSI